MDDVNELRSKAMAELDLDIPESTPEATDDNPAPTETPAPVAATPTPAAKPEDAPLVPPGVKPQTKEEIDERLNKLTAGEESLRLAKEALAEAQKKQADFDKKMKLLEDGDIFSFVEALGKNPDELIETYSKRKDIPPEVRKIQEEVEALKAEKAKLDKEKEEAANNAAKLKQEQEFDDIINGLALSSENEVVKTMSGLEHRKAEVNGLAKAIIQNHYNTTGENLPAKDVFKIVGDMYEKIYEDMKAIKEKTPATVPATKIDNNTAELDKKKPRSVDESTDSLPETLSVEEARKLAMKFLD